MGDLVDVVNHLTINDAKYYESNTAIVSDSQGDLTRNLESVSHTRNGNETFTHTSEGGFEKKLSNWTTPVLTP